MSRIRIALALLAAASVSSAAGAACRFEDWRATSLQAVADRAAAERRLVVLVVSQPDWCPPCIRLDRTWLKNADDSEVGGLTKDALVVEVHGYDEPDASMLQRHHVAFRGTPTTFVFAPVHRGVPLGGAPLRGSIVGAPDDWPAQLRGLIDGHDPIDDLERTIDQQDGTDRISRAKHLLELGDLYASRGDRSQSYMHYRHVRRLHYGGLTDEQAAELKELKREAAWRQADTAVLRVRKDYPEALDDIVAYENGFRSRLSERERNAYSKAWAMANTGDVEGALRVLDRGLSDTPDATESYLYFCFRTGHRTALVAGERKAKEALWRWPERRATWQEAAGRIARRQGRLADAETAFAEAASLEADPETKLVYQGQLEHVRGEIAARQVAALQVAHDDDSSGGSGNGSDAGRDSSGLGR